MSKNLFYKYPLIIQYILGKKIQAITLVDKCTIGFGFIDKKFAKIVCHILEMQPQRSTKPKPIQGFDGRVAKSVTHAIYPTLSVRKHTKSLTPLLSTRLSQQPMIFGHP